MPARKVSGFVFLLWWYQIVSVNYAAAAASTRHVRLPAVIIDDKLFQK